MDDLISRQAAIDALKEYRAFYCDNTPDTFSKLSYVEKSRVDELDMAIATLCNLPSVQSERPKGTWKTERHYFFHVDLPICSYCLQFSPFKYDFCPQCGADMRKVAKVNDKN